MNLKWFDEGTAGYLPVIALGLQDNLHGGLVYTEARDIVWYPLTVYGKERFKILLENLKQYPPQEAFIQTFDIDQVEFFDSWLDDLFLL